MVDQSIPAFIASLGPWYVVLYAISVIVTFIGVINTYSLIFLGADNPLYRTMTWIAVGGGIFAVVYFAGKSVLEVAIHPLIGGEFIYIVPIIMGLTNYFILWPKYSWIARYNLAFIFGVTQGVLFGRGTATWLRQLILTAKIVTIENFLTVVLMFFVGMYFTFHKEWSPLEGKVSGKMREVGRLVLMLIFGGTLAQTVIAYIDTHFFASQLLVQGIKDLFSGNFP